MFSYVLVTHVCRTHLVTQGWVTSTSFDKCHLVVSSARNLELNDKVAIKKITNAFENVVDAKRTLREIKLLQHLTHENVIQVRTSAPVPLSCPEPPCM